MEVLYARRVQSLFSVVFNAASALLYPLSSIQLYTQTLLGVGPSA